MKWATHSAESARRSIADSAVWRHRKRASYGLMAPSGTPHTEASAQTEGMFLPRAEQERGTANGADYAPTELLDDFAPDEEIYGARSAGARAHAAESESLSESGTEGLTWISWFCSLNGHQYFAEVAEQFIEDDFNLTGLNQLVPFYKEALEMILDVEPRASRGGMLADP